MILINQLFKSVGAAEASNHFHNLTKNESTPSYLLNNFGINGRMCPIFHWNAIWHHRIAVEISSQLFEKQNEVMVIANGLKKYRKNYQRMFSTMPLRSNKSFSYYLGMICLDAICGEYSEKNLKKFTSIIRHLVGDGAFVEGSHYSLFCSQSFKSAFILLDKFYKNNHIWNDACDSIKKLEEWQSRIANSEGVVASIGDSWYEKVEQPSTEEGSFSYKDMTILRNKKWVVVKNHRKSPWALHEHPHLNEVLISKDGKWIVQGSGMPSYKQVMAKPFQWRRPRNHFYTELGMDYMYIWRLNKKRIKNRTVTIEDDSLRIYDTGHNTIRWPIEGEYDFKNNLNTITFKYNNANFKVVGEVNNVKRGYAWQSTSYRNFKKVDVIRIEGFNLVTTVV